MTPRETRKDRKYRSTVRCRYGITLEQVNLLLRRQGGKCAICGKKPSDRRLDLDHNHRTKKPRGLLCRNCNRGIGMLRDSVTVLRSAIRYLRRHK